MLLKLTNGTSFELVQTTSIVRVFQDSTKPNGCIIEMVNGQKYQYDETPVNILLQQAQVQPTIPSINLS